MQGPSHGLKSSATPRFAAAAVGTFGTQLGVALLSFASVLVVARTLGPSGRGDVAFVITIAVLSSTLALLGVDEANINFAGRRPELRRALATNSLLLSLVLGAGCVAILVLLISAVPAVGGEADAELRWIAYAAIPLLTLKVYFKFLVRADYHFDIANAAWVLPPALTLLSNLALAIAGRLTVETAITAWFIGHVLATLLLAWYVARRSAGFGRPDLGLARRTLGFGWRSHLGRVMMAGNYRLDQWFVGALAGSRELGLYSIAVSLAEILFYLPTALTIAQRPYLVRATKSEAGRRAARVLRASLLVTTACAAALALVAPLAVPLLFGSEFRGGVDDLQILAAGALGILTLKLLGNALTAQDRPGLATAGATAAFAATLVLDAVLIPSLGGTGAAIASTLAYSSGGVAIVVIFLRHFKLPIRVLLPRPAELPEVARTLGRSLRSRAGQSGAA